MRIKIIWIGKTRNPSIRALTGDYLERLRHLATCEIVELRDLAKLRSLRGGELVRAEGAEIFRHIKGNPRVVALDEKGRQFSSEEFAAWLGREQTQGTQEVCFVIGGGEGLDRDISGKAALNLSLSRMTWTHDMCRMLLLEQIYRAYSILNNIPYHR